MLTEKQINLLKSKYVSRTNFEVAGVIFDCWQGEWQVINNGQHVDVFTFSRMSDQLLRRTLHDIFHNTEKVAFN